MVRALYALEKQASDLSMGERLDLRRKQSAPVLAEIRDKFLAWKEQLLPKHPMAEAVNYALGQWEELNVFCSDGAVPIDNNISEREMKRVVLNRKNSLFVGNARDLRTAGVLCWYSREDILPGTTGPYPALRLVIDHPPRRQIVRERSVNTILCFETIVEDLRSLLRELAGRNARPTAMILDSRTLQSTPESGARAPDTLGRPIMHRPPAQKATRASDSRRIQAQPQGCGLL